MTLPIGSLPRSSVGSISMFAPIACSVRMKPMRVSLMPTSSMVRRRGRGLATTQAIGSEAVEMSPGRVRSKVGSRSGGVRRTVVSVASTATPR